VEETHTPTPTHTSALAPNDTDTPTPTDTQIPTHHNTVTPKPTDTRDPRRHDTVTPKPSDTGTPDHDQPVTPEPAQTDTQPDQKAGTTTPQRNLTSTAQTPAPAPPGQNVQLALVLPAVEELTHEKERLEKDLREKETTLAEKATALAEAEAALADAFVELEEAEKRLEAGEASALEDKNNLSVIACLQETIHEIEEERQELQKQQEELRAELNRVTNQAFSLMTEGLRKAYQEDNQIFVWEVCFGVCGMLVGILGIIAVVWPDQIRMLARRILKREKNIKLVYLPTSVSPGSSATLVIRTKANAICTPSVEYRSGTATPSELERKRADDDGIASWTWLVDPDVAPGKAKVSVQCEPGGSQPWTLMIARHIHPDAHHPSA